MADGLNPLGSGAIDTEVWRHLAGAAPARPAETKGDAGIDKKRAVKVAKDFESVLLQQLLSEMRKSVGDSGLLGDGTSDQVESMFWMFLSRHVAEQGGLGLWKDIYRQTLAAETEGKAKPTVEHVR